MLSLTSIRKIYSDVIVVEDATFTVRAGERVALVGPNGSGKSTLLRLVAGEIQPDGGSIARAPGVRTTYLPQDAGVRPGNTLHEEMVSVFGRVAEIETRQREIEDEMAGLASDEPRLMALVEEQAALHVEFERLDGYTVESSIGKVLGGLGFARDQWDRPTETFSGGWQMRIALAKLLLQEPDILLLDEPTNHLDLAATEWLEEHLTSSRVAAIIVSHDRYFLDRVTRRTIELRGGKTDDYPMAYSRYVEERARRDEAQIEAHQRQQEYFERQYAFVERFRSHPTKHTAAKSREKMLEKVERIARPIGDQRIAFRFPPARESGREVVRVEGVRKSYGSTVVLERAGLVVEKGERVGLIGPNGAGKSTLLRLIAGAAPGAVGGERPDTGRVVLGHNVQLAYFTQSQAEALDPSHTLLEEIYAAAPVGYTQQEARDLLGRFLFRQEDAFKRVAVLSGGERSRLALARLLLQPANVLLLDEPTNHLDIAAREVLEAALRAFGGTTFIASHDRYLLDRVTTRIVEVGAGALTSYAGNYSYYRMKRAQVTTMAPPAAVPPAAPPRPPRQERPRPEREKRGAEQRLARLEAELQRLTTARERLEARLADPELWTSPDAASSVVDELARVQDELDQITTTWERLVAAS